jgi:hypothetical protein
MGKYSLQYTCSFGKIPLPMQKKPYDNTSLIRNLPSHYSKLPHSNSQTDTHPACNKVKVFIISNIQHGGSKKYLDDITTHYKCADFNIITNKSQLYNLSECTSNDILFVQQLLYTDILPNDVLYIKRKFDLKMFICIHDFYWFDTREPTQEPPAFQNMYLAEQVCIPEDIQLLFENSNKIIHPSQFTIDHYKKHFPTHNIALVAHNDYLVNYKSKRIPKIKNKTIVIGNFQQFSTCKGSENIKKIYEKYTHYKGYALQFKIVDINIPRYTEENWYNLIIYHQFHCLLHLNKFGETYSYTLTKSINSGLPILYNNVGSFKYRIPKKEHYIKVIDDEKDYDNEGLLFNAFEKMLDYIIKNNGLFNNSNNNNNTLIYNSFYDTLFGNA